MKYVDDKYTRCNIVIGYVNKHWKKKCYKY